MRNSKPLSPRVSKPAAILTIISLIAALILAACGGGAGHVANYSVSDKSIPITGPAVPGADALDQNVTNLLKKWDVPGAAVAILKDGKLVLARGYGYSNLESGTAMQPDRLFRIGSASKMLTAVSILQLVVQGRLSLDDKAADVLGYTVPDTADARLKRITVRMLLQHSGGWDRNISGDVTNEQAAAAKAAGHAPPATCADFVPYLATKKLDFDPGTRFAYSNVGYCVLGEIVAKVSGENYETYVKNHVLAPMGIQDMYLGTTRQGRQGPGEVTYYDYPNAPMGPSIFPGEGNVPLQYGVFEMLGPCGGWVGSPLDLVRFMSALDGTRTTAPLSAEMMQQMLADPGLPGMPAGEWYGLGVFVGPGSGRWCHGGSLPGAQTSFCREGSQYTYAIITNSRTKDPDTFAVELDQLVEKSIGSNFIGSPVDLFGQF